MNRPEFPAPIERSDTGGGSVSPLLVVFVWIAVIVGLLIGVAGCAEARRVYRYETSVSPDGTVTKAINVEILNSDVKVGQLEAQGADGTVLKLNDLDAQERASVIMQIQAEALGNAVGKLIPDTPITP